MSNIYVVDVHDGNNVDQVSRYVLIAESAADAEIYASRKQWPGATAEARAELIKDRVEAGRIGTYEPGIAGATLVRTDMVAVQRMGQR